jgi:hypothetical protein
MSKRKSKSPPLLNPPIVYLARWLPIITPISVVVVKKREVIFTKEGNGLLSYNDDSGSGDQREPPAGVDAGKWQ